MAMKLTKGTAVSYQYRRHYLLGGELVSGRGTIVGETIVGTEDAYVIKPADGSPSVDVYESGVRAD